MTSETAPAPEIDLTATTHPNPDILRRAYRLLRTGDELARLYEENKAVTAKYVHATARGHEAIQLAAAACLMPQDYAAP